MRLLERIQYKIFQALNPLLFSSFYIKNVDLPYDKNSTRSISVAIPHYQRGKKIHVTLKNILKDKRIKEIVILDDGSSREEFQNLVDNLSQFSGKIKLFRREENLGILRTKIQVVSLCTNEWVILLDSDNSIFSQYLNAIFRLPKWNENTIYCPDFAYPNFDFRALSGEIMDFQKFSNLDVQRSGAFMNDGNYFFNKINFLNALLPYSDFKALADVIFANYIWLSQGNKLEVLHNAPYFHRVHPGSIWVNTKNENIKHAELVGDLLINGIKADKDYLSKIFEVLPNAWVEPIPVPLRSA
jgi:glycosyltransferase involved in cell wall biosynthesis